MKIWGFNWRRGVLMGLIALIGMLCLRLLVVDVACPIKLEEMVCKDRSGETYLVYISYMAKEVPPELYAEARQDHPGKCLYIVVIDPDCKWAVTYNYIPWTHYEYTKRWIWDTSKDPPQWWEVEGRKNILDQLYEDSLDNR